MNSDERIAFSIASVTSALAYHYEETMNDDIYTKIRDGRYEVSGDRPQKPSKPEVLSKKASDLTDDEIANLRAVKEQYDAGMQAHMQASKKSKKPKPDTSANWKYAPGCIVVDNGTEHGGDVIFEMGRDGVGPTVEDGQLMAAAPKMFRTLVAVLNEAVFFHPQNEELRIMVEDAIVTAIPSIGTTIDRLSKVKK